MALVNTDTGSNVGGSNEMATAQDLADLGDADDVIVPPTTTTKPEGNTSNLTACSKSR
jgi:hypothetical protein